MKKTQRKRNRLKSRKTKNATQKGKLGHPGAAGHGSKKDKTQAAIAALLSERTVEAAAKKVGIGYRTLKAWLAKPDFQKAYRRARQEILERTIARLLAITSDAVDTLRRNLRCRKPGVEIRAAELVLGRAFGGAELLGLVGEAEERKPVHTIEIGTNERPPEPTDTPTGSSGADAASVHAAAGNDPAGGDPVQPSSGPEESEEQ